MSVTGNLRFLGFIEEDDGTLTMECVDEAGVRHEFRRAELQGVEVKEVDGRRIDFEFKMLPIDEEES